jgi:hypothetical protein
MVMQVQSPKLVIFLTLKTHVQHLTQTITRSQVAITAQHRSKDDSNSGVLDYISFSLSRELKKKLKLKLKLKLRKKILTVPCSIRTYPSVHRVSTRIRIAIFEASSSTRCLDRVC